MTVYEADEEVRSSPGAIDANCLSIRAGSVTDANFLSSPFANQATVWCLGHRTALPVVVSLLFRLIPERLENIGNMRAFHAVQSCLIRSRLMMSH